MALTCGSDVKILNAATTCAGTGLLSEHITRHLQCCNSYGDCRAPTVRARDAQQTMPGVPVSSTDKAQFMAMTGSVGDEGKTFDLLLAGIAANVQEVGGRAAVQLDDVHGRHRQTGAVDHATDLPIQPDVVQIVLRRRHFPAEGEASICLHKAT